MKIKGKYGISPNGKYWAVVYTEIGYVISGNSELNTEQEVFEFFKQNLVDSLNVEFSYDS
jgi:hypothetical protein